MSSPQPTQERSAATLSNVSMLSTHQYSATLEPLSLKEPLDDSEVSFPEGGLQAWLVVLGGFCLSVSTFGFINSWGTFQAYYETVKLPNSSPSAIAWIGSIQYSLIFLPGLFAGRLFDLGHFRFCLIGASILFVISNFLIAECQKYWHFVLCQGVALGLACGWIYVPCVAAVAQWFLKRRPVAFSTISMGVAVGGIIFPIMFRNLVSRIGFPWTVRAMAFINLFLFLVANLTMRTRLPTSSVTRGFDARAFAFLPYTFYVLSTFFAFLGLYTMLTFLTVSAVTIGINPNLAFYLIAIVNALSAVGRIAGGGLSMKYGAINMMILFTLLAGVTTYIWPFTTSHGGFIAVSCFYGIGTGAFVGLFPVGTAQLGNTHDIGSRTGMQMSIMALGALGGPPISGAIVQRDGNFHDVGIYAGTMITFSVILMVCTRYAALKRLVGGVM